MNPISVSLIFVIVYIVISLIKHLIYPQVQPPPHSIYFNKVFQLTSNKAQSTIKHYNSLFEAYNKYQIQDVEKITNLLPNRDLFNQSVLAETLKNQQSFYVCGSDYFVVSLTGIFIEQGQVKWMTKLQIYKLPLLSKIKVIQINEKLILPRKCKQNLQQNFYYLYMVDNGVFLKLKIHNDQTYLTTLIPSQGINVNNPISGFQFQSSWVAHWSNNKPWLINIENFQNQRSVVQNNHLQINLLQLRKQNNSALYKTSNLQQIHIRQIQIIKVQQSIQLAIIYSSHEFGNLYRQLFISTFLILDKNMQVSQINHNYQWKQVNTFSIDGQYASYQQDQCQCEIFLNEEQKNGISLSCLIGKINLEKVKFIIKYNIFYTYQNLNITIKQNDAQNSKMGNFKQLLLKNNSQDSYYFNILAYFFADDDENITSQDKKQQVNQIQQIIFYLPISPRLPRKLIKSSTPNPIIFYQEGNQYFLYAFSSLQKLQNQNQEQPQKLPFVSFPLHPPASLRDQQKILREIKWIQIQKLIIVIWGSGIQVYKYTNFDLSNQDLDGITMATLLPLIQLFATTFCLLRIL